MGQIPLTMYGGAGGNGKVEVKPMFAASARLMPEWAIAGTSSVWIVDEHVDAGSPVSVSRPPYVNAIRTDPPAWMKCPHCGIRNRTEHKTVLTCEQCGGNLDGGAL